MSSSFPIALDNFTIPVSSTPLNGGVDHALAHSSQHANLNSAITAIESAIGINGSVDSNSIQYKLNSHSAAIESLSSVNVVSSSISNIQKFMTAGTFTWTCPAGVTKILLTGAAGGGGGAYGLERDNIAGNTCFGGGGGQGGEAILETLVDVVPGQVYNIIIGAGGTGAPNQGNNASPEVFGNTGGVTGFGSLVTLAGGLGGGPPSPSSYGYPRGADHNGQLGSYCHIVGGGTGGDNIAGGIGGNSSAGLLGGGGAGGTGNWAGNGIYCGGKDGGAGFLIIKW